MVKYHLFSLKSSDAFLKYADLKKAYIAMLPELTEEIEKEEQGEEEVVA